jgi:hypothetical protein
MVLLILIIFVSEFIYWKVAVRILNWAKYRSRVEKENKEIGRKP